MLSVPGQKLQPITQLDVNSREKTDIYLSTCYLQPAEDSCAFLTLYRIASQDKTLYFIIKEAVSAQ